MSQGASRLELNPVSVALIDWEYLYFPPWMGCQFSAGLPPALRLLLPIYIPSCTARSKVKHTNPKIIMPPAFIIIVFKANLILFYLVKKKTVYSLRSWKTQKVMEFYNYFISQACKVLKFRCGSWKSWKTSMLCMNERQ